MTEAEEQPGAMGGELQRMLVGVTCEAASELTEVGSWILTSLSSQDDVELETSACFQENEEETIDNRSSSGASGASVANDQAPVLDFLPSRSDSVDATTSQRNYPISTKSSDRSEEARRKRFAEKHALRPAPDACKDGCDPRCFQKIDETTRRKINFQVNHLDYAARNQWYRTFVKVNETGKARRYLTWHLPDESCDVTRVCKTFFLTTLGFAENSDTAVQQSAKTASGDRVTAPPDKRGKHVPANKADHDNIKQHIMSFHPQQHHYRYNHAPHRMYLPSDITVRVMYSDYVEKHGRHICQETYRKIVQELNIGFTLLGSEECSKCKAFQQHLQECHGGQSDSDPSCVECEAQAVHLASAKEARDEY